MFIESVLAQFPSLTASGVFKVLQITVPLSKIHCSPYKFKKNRPVKKWTIWGTFGPKFPFFFSPSLWPSEGSWRPNRAAVTPIGQHNPPGPLKLLGSRQKTCKNTDF
jgi:hypothetical protein